MDYSKWKVRRVDPLDIKLDELNPRVFLNDYSQENIRKFLLKHFEVIDLAKSILQNGGLPPTERILCIEENGELVVVEGNRRVTACQIIRKPNLIPSEFKSHFKASSSIRQQFSQIEVVVAPNRDVTEGYITLRHTTSGVKSWSRLAENRRYIIRYVEKKQSIRNISILFNLPESQIKKGIQFYYFMEYVKKCLNWNKNELEIINNPLLETTKLDRFLPFSTNAKNILTITFDSSHKLKYEIPKVQFDKALKSIITKIFITNDINTRSAHNQVFTDEIKRICSIDNTKKDSETVLDKSSDKTDTSLPGDNVEDKSNTTTKYSTKNNKDNNTSNTNNPKPQSQPKPAERNFLFQNIIYTGKHRGIERVLYELQKLDYRKYKLSATYLVRTLLECTLQEFLISNGLFSSWKRTNRDPSFSDLLNYCITHKSFNAFNTNLQRIIENSHALRDHDQLNSIAHAKFNEPTEAILIGIEKRWYFLIDFCVKNLNDAQN